jgi:uncharacterized protein YgiM (DUF1202 family)
MATSRFAFMLPIGLVAAAMVPIAAQSPKPAPPPASGRRAAPPALPAPAADPVGRRVVVTAASAPAYSCAAVTCKVVAELEKGAVVSLLKTDGDWHQVMVRVGATSMTTGWVRAAQVASSSSVASRGEGAAANAASMRGAKPELTDEDPRGCLTCLATREPTREEWDVILADTATKKLPPEAPDRAVAPGLADGRTGDERMHDRFIERYGAEVDRLAGAAGNVDADLQTYLGACFERFASIKVVGAAPRRTAVDDILASARATKGGARFALWNGSPGFAWKPEWAPQPNDSSSLPSCERLWTDVVVRADRLKVDLELLERDATEHEIYPGIVREALATRNLAESTEHPPSAPVVDVR